MKLQSIINVIEKIAPPTLACEWDNVGLMIGDINSDINAILLSLDYDENALKAAIKCGANLIITHHPAIFKPISSITDKLLIETIKNDVCVYSAHTNFDCANGGVNYVLADLLGMYDCTQQGMMRIGKVKEESLANMIEKIKISLGTRGVRFVGDLNKTIKKVAVLGGSGGDFIKDAFDLGCDLLVTGECKYSQAQYAQSLGISVVEAGHFETENPAIKKLAESLRRHIDIEIIEVKPNNIFKII